jgi:hypothetical protein
MEWKNHILTQGEVILGGVSFIVDVYDFRNFDGGTDHFHIWVNITEFPPDL